MKIFLNKKTILDLVTNINVALFFMLVLLDRMSFFNVNLEFFPAYIIWILLLLHSYKKQQIEQVKMQAFVALFMLILGCLSSCYNHVDIPLHYFFVFSVYLPVAIALLYFPIKSYTAIIVYLFLAMILISHFLRNWNFFTFFSESSENYVSIILLFYTGLLCIAKTSLSVVWVSSLLNVIISTAAIGRGGIITTVFFLLGCTMLVLFQNSFKYKYLILSMMICFLIILSYYAYNYGFFDVMQYNFEAKGMESSRTYLIWIPYLNDVLYNGMNLIFGANYLWYVPFEHLHSSFLMIHALYGIVIFIITVGLLLSCLFRYYRECNYLMLLFFITFLMRAFTDYMFPNVFCAVWFFYFIMYPLCKKKEA